MMAGKLVQNNPINQKTTDIGVYCPTGEYGSASGPDVAHSRDFAKNSKRTRRAF
jgi:hypothetical protein